MCHVYTSHDNVLPSNKGGKLVQNYNVKSKIPIKKNFTLRKCALTVGTARPKYIHNAFIWKTISKYVAVFIAY